MILIQYRLIKQNNSSAQFNFIENALIIDDEPINHCCSFIAIDEITFPEC